MTTQQQMQHTIVQRLFWHTAERDEAKVADHLFRHQQMDSVFTLDEAVLFDSFFHYLREIQVFPLIEEITPHKQQREHVPFLQFILIFLMKVIASIPKMEQTHDLLLTDELLMGLCGFNAYQVRNGSCQRGLKHRKTPPPEIRGAVCVDTVARQIVQITPKRVENFFNQCIKRLALCNAFPKFIHAACDATDFETTRQFKGCGAVSRERKVKARGRRKNGELKTVKVTVYGWKLWAVYELNSGIPLAIKIDTIEKPDNLHVLAALQQAKENVGPKSTIRSLVVDRGFLDGKVLFAIDQQGIEFVVPLKSNMSATTDARQLALLADQSYRVQREVQVTHGYGNKKRVHAIRTELVGVPGLLTCEWFHPEGSEAAATRKDFQPNPLNAVVVKTWDNKTPPVDKQVVLATNGSVQDPFIAFDRYDDRSLIENNLFRETKQNWCLQDPPQKSKEGVWVQVYLVMAMKALSTAFLLWQQQQSQLHQAGEQTSWYMYRRKLKAFNRNKLIVFVDNYFGIFASHEVFMLAGVPVLDVQKDLKLTRDQIYSRYTGRMPIDSS